ncbi:hypothetical protein [Stackebrandtia soli]|uniref:hypothetical protein n=1 Tax=Stackebrandtia soli TaxID=1892856 RepID=UPI0039E80A64
MAERKETPEAEAPRFPQRDEDGRIVSLVEALAYALFMVAVGVVLLCVIDGLFWIFGESFGQISGWISGILAVFIFVDDFRAWRFVTARWIVAPVAAALAVVTGLGLITLLPVWWLPLLTGALAVASAVVIYTVLWFIGVRLLSGER